MLSSNAYPKRLENSGDPTVTLMVNFTLLPNVATYLYSGLGNREYRLHLFLAQYIIGLHQSMHERNKK